MFCVRCGKPIEDSSSFCPYCGKELKIDNSNENAKVNVEPVEQAGMEQECVVSCVQPNVEASKPKLGMKWYKFLIYFSLWAGAVVNIISAVMVLTGTIYINEGVSPELVYSTFNGLKTIDTIYGIGLILLAVIQIVTRFKLARYKKDALKWLIITYVLVIVVELFYNLMVMSFIGFQSTVITTIIVSVIMIFANKTYFTNRKELFIY